MTVRLVLEGKGRHVSTAPADTRIGEIVRVLAERRIGAIVLASEAGRIVGIVSERDVVRALAAEGAGMLDRPVSGVMTRTVVTCREDERVVEVLRKMTDGRFRHMPVVHGDGALCGIVSIGDLVKHRLGQLEAEADAMRDYIVTA